MSMISNRNCCVPQCHSKASKSSFSFHRFPSSEKENLRRKKWLLALRIGKNVSYNMLVCSKHFVKTDFFLHHVHKKARLKKTAVPSQFLPMCSTNKKPEAERNNHLIMDNENERTCNADTAGKKESQKYQLIFLTRGSPSSPLSNNVSLEPVVTTQLKCKDTVKSKHDAVPIRGYNCCIKEFSSSVLNDLKIENTKTLLKASPGSSSVL